MMSQHPTTPIRAVAFDLDGLIFDTEALFFQVADAMLARRGKRFTHEIMAAMIGRSWAIAGPAFKSMAELSETTDELLAEARGDFLARIDHEVNTTPGFLTLLDQVESLDLPRAVATSSRRDYAARLLDNHRLTSRFAFVLGAEDVVKHKPDPEIYLTAARRFEVDPSAMLVLEDTPAGVAAARAAGAFVVAIPHEHSPSSGLGNADMIVSSLDHPDLLARITSPR